jgi:hypothetical protein
LLLADGAAAGAAAASLLVLVLEVNGSYIRVPLLAATTLTTTPQQHLVLFPRLISTMLSGLKDFVKGNAGAAKALDSVSDAGIYFDEGFSCSTSDRCS